jgi:hypothetical protein
MNGPEDMEEDERQLSEQSSELWQRMLTEDKSYEEWLDQMEAMFGARE